MIRLITIIMFLLLSSDFSYSNDIKDVYLRPEDGSFLIPGFGSYYENINKVLLKCLNERPLIKMVVLPSFETERMCGIFQNDDKYYVFSVESSIKIWNYEALKLREKGSIRTIYSPKTKNLDSLNEQETNNLRLSLPESLDKIPVKYHKKLISKKMYLLIEKTWISILMRVKYSEGFSRGLDGISYHFSVSIPDENYFMSGQT